MKNVYNKLYFWLRIFCIVIEGYLKNYQTFLYLLANEFIFFPVKLGSKFQVNHYFHMKLFLSYIYSRKEKKFTCYYSVSSNPWLRYFSSGLGYTNYPALIISIQFINTVVIKCTVVDSGDELLLPVAHFLAVHDCYYLSKIAEFISPHYFLHSEGVLQKKRIN